MVAVSKADTQIWQLGRYKVLTLRLLSIVTLSIEPVLFCLLVAI